MRARSIIAIERLRWLPHHNLEFGDEHNDSWVNSDLRCSFDRSGRAVCRATQQPASPIFGVTIPQGYRDWGLVASFQETGNLDELRAVVGNALSMTPGRSNALPFPDGAILVKLAYKRLQSTEFPAAFILGSPPTVQVMVKDSKRYASTGGWGLGRFVNGAPVDEAQRRTCLACHAAHVVNHDFVFTRHAP